MVRVFKYGNLLRLLCFYTECLFKNQKFQTLSGKLSWSHYLLLLGVDDLNERSFYQHECENSNWSVRELDRQIDSGLYERLLLSRGEANKLTVLELANKGVTYQTPDSFIKDPMVLEFVGLPEKPFLESDLEKAIVDHIEDFLLELGRGFMFVGTQQRNLLCLPGQESFFLFIRKKNSIMVSENQSLRRNPIWKQI